MPEAPTVTTSPRRPHARNHSQHRASWLIAAVLAVFAGAGCRSVVPVQAAASTAPIGTRGIQRLAQVEARRCVFSLFGFLPASGDRSIRKTISDALADAGGAADGIVELTVDTEVHSAPPVFSEACTIVRGTAFRYTD